MKRIVLWMSVLAPLLAGQANAQIASSRSGSTGVYVYDNETVMRTVVSFGRCFARENPRASLEWIATAPSSREEYQVYQRLARSGGVSCLQHGSTLTATPTLLRGAVAEGMLAAGTIVPPSHRQPIPTRAQVRNLSDAARCHAGANRAQVRALLTTRAGSRDEAARITELARTFPDCLPPGVSLQYDGTLLRFRLAEAMLRMEAAAPNGAAAAAN